MTESTKAIAWQGLWHNNPALVQLLGLCPLLAVSNTLVNALGLGLATMVILCVSNICVALLRHRIRPETRLPVFVMVIAGLTTCIELLMQAFTFELYQLLGIFIPLIVTNCSVLGRAEAFAAKNPVRASALDGLMMGLGFTWVLCVLGVIRELLGQGTVFANMHLLFGSMAESWTLQVLENPFLLMLLPSGAFITLGFLLAGKNYLAQYVTRSKQTLAKQALATQQVAQTDDT